MTVCNMDKKSLIDQACTAAEEFTKIYYENLDKRRALVSKIYLDTAQMVWNGNAITGSEEVRKFLDTLPSTVHTVLWYDAQPVVFEAVENQMTVVLTAGGSVKMSGRSTPFMQSFILTAKDGKWKIVSDNFRLQQVNT